MPKYRLRTPHGTYNLTTPRELSEQEVAHLTSGAVASQPDLDTALRGMLAGEAQEAKQAIAAGDVGRYLVPRMLPAAGALAGTLGGGPVGAALGAGPKTVTAITSLLEAIGGGGGEQLSQALGLAPSSPGAVVASAGLPLAGRAAGAATQGLAQRGPWAVPGRQTMVAERARGLGTRALQPMPQEEIDALYAASRRGMAEAPPEALAPLQRPMGEPFRPMTRAREIPRWQEGEKTLVNLPARERQIPFAIEGEEMTYPASARRALEQTAPFNLMKGRELTPMQRPLVEAKGVPGAYPAEEARELLPLMPKQIPAAPAPAGMTPEELTFPGGVTGAFSRRLYGLETPGETSALPEAVRLYQTLGRATRVGDPERRQAAKRMFGALGQELEDYITQKRPGWESVWDFLRAQSQQKRAFSARELDEILEKAIRPTGAVTERANIKGLRAQFRTPTGRKAFTEKMTEQVEPGAWAGIEQELQQLQAMEPSAPIRALYGWGGRIAGPLIGGAAGGATYGAPGALTGSLLGIGAEQVLERLGASRLGLNLTKRAWQSPLLAHPRLAQTFSLGGQALRPFAEEQAP